MVTQVNPSDVTFRRPVIQTNRRVAIGPSRMDQESFRAQIDVCLVYLGLLWNSNSFTENDSTVL